MPLLVSVICAIHDYKIFLIATDQSSGYVLVKKEISEECGIPSNKKKTTLKLVSQVKEPESRALLKRMLIMFFKLLPE
jgi:hypothetical protein